MRYHHVTIAGLGYVLPPHVVTSEAIEARLEPLYRRLRLPAGRLELMSGIAQRRVWADGTLPSQMSIRSGELALQASGIPPQEIGALLHASVCRDHLEPATACRVHHMLDLPPQCLVYDVSNACLGVLNGILQIANMIELGQIQNGLVVATEDSRPLLETTLTQLNRDSSLTRQSIKTAVASLTIGSASCAILLSRTGDAPSGAPLLVAAARSESAHHELCRSGRDEAVADGMQPLMHTDSESLMHHGVQTGRDTFGDFLQRLQDVAAEGNAGAASTEGNRLDKVVCHQVGVAHRRLLLETLGIDPQQDYVTYPWLGNTGSAALPVTLARAAEAGHFAEGDRVGLLGIGSGINCLMLALRWQAPPVLGVDLAASN